MQNESVPISFRTLIENSLKKGNGISVAACCSVDKNSESLPEPIIRTETNDRVIRDFLRP
jgi:hypothetical protein